MIGAAVLQYLPETIQSFSTQSRKTVSSLIQNVKTDKAQISSLIEGLRTFEAQANYTPSLALRYSSLNIEAVVEFFRDSSLRTGSFFGAASSISSILNSIVHVFSSEIEKIEKDIYHLSNFVDNYQFIAGEDDLFNFNYVENFDNSFNSIDLNSLDLFDRDGIKFSKNGNYYIDPVLSKISISNGKSFSNVIGNVKNISYSNNYSQYITTDTGFENLFDEFPDTNWTVTAKSPVVLTSQLPNIGKYINYDYSYIRGAQSIVDMNFVNDVEMDFIRISPTDSSGMQLLQVILTKTDPLTSQLTTNVSNEYIDFPVLNSPLYLDKTVDVLFDKCRVSSIKFIFNQSKYIRSENTPIFQELNSKILKQISKNKRKNSVSKMQDLVYFYFKNANDINKLRNNNKVYTEYYSYRYPQSAHSHADGVLENFNQVDDIAVNNRLENIIEKQNDNQIENIVQTIVSHVIGSRANLFNNRVYRSNADGKIEGRMYTVNSDGFIPHKSESENIDLLLQKDIAQMPGLTRENAAKYLINREISNSYEYSFSIKSIQFGQTIFPSQNKACFISKNIETNGAPLGIKALVNKVKQRKDLNYLNYDISEAGSYELSVSCSDNILSEQDWIPLDASGNGVVDSEILFFDNSSSAKLRFIPIEATIKIYKNGLLENPNNWTYFISGNSVRYNTSIDSKAIYVISYQIDNMNYTQNLIDMDKIKNSNFAVKSYSNKNISGQHFVKTGPGNRIALEYIPYIEDKFQNASYSSTFGTINTVDNIGYQPIKITLDNGMTAINLTNYVKNNFTKANFYSTDQYLFIQSGKDIIFNQPISIPFVVNYDYIPASLKFRLILRNNIPSQNNCLSIDNVVIKCKTKNLDSFSEKLLRLK